MANIKSQKDRIITNEKAHQLNKAKKSRIATEIRKFRELLAGSKVKEAEEQLKVVIGLIDRARLDNVYHSNTAARKVSTLSRSLSNAKAKK